MVIRLKPCSQPVSVFGEMLELQLIGYFYPLCLDTKFRKLIGKFLFGFILTIFDRDSLIKTVLKELLV